MIAQIFHQFGRSIADVQRNRQITRLPYSSQGIINAQISTVALRTRGTFEHDSRYSDNIVENAYVDEMQNFIGVIKGLEQPKYSYEKDLYTIKIMDEIEGIK